MSMPRLPITALLCSSLFLTGMSAAAVAPYRAVIAIDGLGMANASFALVITISSIATAVASLMLGQLADRIGDRRLLVIFTSVMGALAYGLIYLFPTPLSYIVAFCCILPFGGTLFSQSFSFSRAYFDSREPERSQFMMSVLRSTFAAAWVIVPPLAGWIAVTYSVPAVLAVSALAHLGCTLVFGLLLTDPNAQVSSAVPKPKDGARGWALPIDRLVGIGGITLVRVALAMHVSTMPLAILNDYHGTLTDVGFNAALAAGLEVPLMLAWGWAASRMAKETIIVINAAIYGIYMLLLVTIAHSVTNVLWLQGLNAIATAALLSLTISYMQETIKGRVGLSTALMDVVTVVSAMVAAGIFALFTTTHSYVAAFGAGAVLSVLGCVAMGGSRLLERRKLQAA